MRWKNLFRFFFLLSSLFSLSLSSAHLNQRNKRVINRREKLLTTRRRLIVVPRYCDDNESVMKQKFICFIHMLVYQVCNCNLYFLFRIGSKNKTSSTFFSISFSWQRMRRRVRKVRERERKRHERKGYNSMKKSWKEQKNFPVNLSSLFQEPKKRKQKLFDFVPGIVFDYSPLLRDYCSKCHHKTAGSITATAILTVALNLVVIVVR